VTPQPAPAPFAAALAIQCRVTFEVSSVVVGGDAAHTLRRSCERGLFAPHDAADRRTAACNLNNRRSSFMKLLAHLQSLVSQFIICRIYIKPSVYQNLDLPVRGLVNPRFNSPMSTLLLHYQYLSY
jgi:hypothetical protein